jgi:hypothetical protein
MRSVVFIVAIAAAFGCGNKPGGGDGGGGGGGSGAADMTMVAPPDLTPRPTAGIACGADTCTTGLELCCTADNGATGVCQMIQNPSCGSSVFFCDGPEDCEPASPECCVMGGYAACQPAGYCAGQANASVMCHTSNSTCAPPATCHAATNSPYAICF